MTVDEMIFEIGAANLQGRFSGDSALFVSFAAVGKSDSKCQGLASKHGMDAKP